MAGRRGPRGRLRERAVDAGASRQMQEAIIDSLPEVILELCADFVVAAIGRP
jgi:hypothetical protein